jgi:DNA-directed RNA polymerase specialized sigma subunit
MTINDEHKMGLLKEAIDETNLMREMQEHITVAGENRRMIWHELYEDGMFTQKEIALACGVTKGVVYKEIKRYSEWLAQQNG